MATIASMPRLASPDPSLPRNFTAAQARAAGLTADQVRQRVRSGAWVRIARGHYRRSDGPAHEPVDPYDSARVDHVQRAVAAAIRRRGSTIGCHSAALALGLSLFDSVPQEVALVSASEAYVGRRGNVMAIRGHLDPTDVLHVLTSDTAGLSVAVTSALRTWLDIARRHSLADALAVGDAALRARLVTPEELTHGVELVAGSRGCRKAALALSHLDGRRESPLESGSWAYFVEYDVPLPAMQVDVRDARGRFVGRVDFLWDAARVIGECDGRMKYRTPRDLYEEKRREDGLRDLGYRVVRWGWADLRNPGLAERIRRRVLVEMSK